MKLLLSILMIFSCLSLQAKDKGLTLKRGNTYYIYTSPDAPDVVRHAAAELDTYLAKAIGVHSRKLTATFVAKHGVVVTAVALLPVAECLKPINWVRTATAWIFRRTV